jgi:hypothetical protein
LPQRSPVNSEAAEESVDRGVMLIADDNTDTADVLAQLLDTVARARHSTNGFQSHWTSQR